MNSFSNLKIDINELPDYKKTVLTPIAPRYKKVVLFNLILSTVIVLAIAFTISFFVLTEISWLYKAILLTVLFVVLMLINALSLVAFKRRSYAFREQDVIYQSGILTITHEIVPYNRLQHVVLKQGWFSRYLGLATIECFTAASANNEIAIPGLELEQAEHIKGLLLNKINNTDLNDLQKDSDLLNDSENLDTEFVHHKNDLNETN